MTVYYISPWTNPGFITAQYNVIFIFVLSVTCAITIIYSQLAKNNNLQYLTDLRNIYNTIQSLYKSLPQI